MNISSDVPKYYHIKQALLKDMKKGEVTGKPFEIQVRTIAQDAWASVSYHLDYKKEETIPVELRRDFYALSGLFYIADQHFKILRDVTFSKVSLTRA